MSHFDVRNSIFSVRYYNFFPVYPSAFVRTSSGRTPAVILIFPTIQKIIYYLKSKNFLII